MEKREESFPTMERETDCLKEKEIKEIFIISSLSTIIGVSALFLLLTLLNK